MVETDFLSIALNGILKASREKRQELLALLGGVYEIKELQKRNMVSIGIEDSQGRKWSLQDWLEANSEVPSEVRLYRFTTEVGALAPHIMAAFTGNADHLLVTIYKNKVFALGPQTYYSLDSQLSSEVYFQFIRAQKNATDLEALTLQMINDSNGMNNRPPVTAAELQAYLKASETDGGWSFHSGNLLQEAQVKSLVAGIKLEIPTDLEDKFEYTDDIESFGASDDVVYIFIRGNDSSSPAKILEFINHFSLADSVWEELSRMRASTEMHEEFYKEMLPDLNGKDWEKHLLGLNAEQMSSLGYIYLRALSEIAAKKGVELEVPEKFAKDFGPSSEEQVEGKFRGFISSGNGIRPKINENRWRTIIYQMIDIGGDVGLKKQSYEKPDLQKSLKNYAASLEKAAAFAKVNESPYEACFAMAKAVIDVADFDSMPAKIQSQGHPEIAMENFERDFATAKEFSSYGYSGLELTALLAFSLTNIFGGMGSWNDQSFDDMEQFMDLSAELFDNRTALFDSLFNHR